MSQLKKDEIPSSRRLQARAAKSALKRVQQLYDSETAKGILNSIQDSNERNVKAAELRNNVETEIQNLAQRLTDLVPNDLSLDNRYNTNIQQYDSSYYERTSSNEYVVNEARVGRRRRTKISPAIENMLLEQEQQSAKPIDDEEQYAKTIDENMMKPYGYEDSALTMYNKSDLVSDSNMTEDEFIEAWLSERKNPPGAGRIGESADKSKSTNDDEEKDDENQKIYLV